MISKRKIIGLFFLLIAILIWIPSGDVIDMIIRQKEILFGRYSRGHFAGLFVLTLILLGLAALSFSRIKTVGEMLLVSLMVCFSVGISGFILIVGSGWAVQPRYIEKVVETEEAGKKITGLVRHRPPNEFFELTQIDKPEQQRSYPNAPAGYPSFDLTLTTDSYGFRNPMIDGQLLSEYPIVAVGDSFVAGSHVSDRQAWVALLSEQLATPVYNLGVSGSDPGNYYNNFMLLGRKFKPKKVLFMLYEGNDFKKISPLLVEEVLQDQKIKKTGIQHSGKSIAYYVKASPVIKGLHRYSTEILEVIGKNRSVPGYQEQVGFMPIKVSGESWEHFYSFEPKRLIYLTREKGEFKGSRSWKQIVKIMDDLVDQGKQGGYEMYFIYAPSTPHVIMPLVRERIPADQLHRFASYQEDNLPTPEVFKQQVFQWMDNEQEVFEEHCQMAGLHCLALTDSLQKAAAEGQQVYYSYDQHWTPEGNKVVADTIGQWLASESRY